MRVALDTNVLVSAVATRGLCADLFNLVLAEHELIVGEAVLAELRKVLRAKMRVPGKIIDEYVTLLRQEGTVVKAARDMLIAIRDEADVVVVAEAIAGKADVLVTGDRDLLDVARKLPIPVLTPRGLWELLREDASP